MKKFFFAVLAVSMLLAFSVPAALADTKIGGIVFTDVYYLRQDSNRAASRGLSDDSLTTFNLNVPNNSRIYVRWTNEDNVGMYIEGGVGDAGDTWSLRHAYGWWDINPAFTLMAGWSTTPFSPLIPTGQNLGRVSGHVSGYGFGEFYSGRFPQVRGTWRLPNKLGDLAVAIVDPKVGPTYGGVFESKIPRIEAALALRMGTVNIYPGAFWQRNQYENLAGDDNLDAWGTSLGIRTSLGPFQLDAEVNYGENFANTQGGGTTLPILSPPGYAAAGFPLAAAQRVGTSFEDTDVLTYWVKLALPLGPATLNATFGQARFENDAVDTDVRTTMYGISAPITMAKGFIVRPEIFRYDYGDGSRGRVGGVETDFGTEILGGVQFQIVF
jgi:hypothetical protein